MRDRLIELISQVQYMGGLEGQLADYLIDNGVIVPPCKVGQTVYAISENRIAECTCRDITIGIEMLVETDHNCDYDCKGCPFNSWGQDYSGEHSCQGEYGIWFFKFEDFGKTVFLTRKEAEKALAERSENEHRTGN